MLPFGIAIVLCGGPIVAESPEVPLYTNADLERLEPLTLERQFPVRNEAEIESREFVSEFLERAHARIDAERDRDLARAELSTREVERPGIAYLYDPGRAGSYYATNRHRYRGNRAQAGGGARASAIRPLHAGPSHTMQMRAKAIRNSGSDAVPRRGR